MPLDYSRTVQISGMPSGTTDVLEMTATNNDIYLLLTNAILKLDKQGVVTDHEAIARNNYSGLVRIGDGWATCLKGYRNFLRRFSRSGATDSELTLGAPEAMGLEYINDIEQYVIIENRLSRQAVFYEGERKSSNANFISRPNVSSSVSFVSLPSEVPTGQLVMTRSHDMFWLGKHGDPATIQAFDSAFGAMTSENQDISSEITGGNIQGLAYSLGQLIILHKDASDNFHLYFYGDEPATEQTTTETDDTAHTALGYDYSIELSRHTAILRIDGVEFSGTDNDEIYILNRYDADNIFLQHYQLDGTYIDTPALFDDAQNIRGLTHKGNNLAYADLLSVGGELRTQIVVFDPADGSAVDTLNLTEHGTHFAKFPHAIVYDAPSNTFVLWYIEDNILYAAHVNANSGAVLDKLRMPSTIQFSATEPLILAAHEDENDSEFWVMGDLNIEVIALDNALIPVPSHNHSLSEITNSDHFEGLGYDSSGHLIVMDEDNLSNHRVHFYGVSPAPIRSLMAGVPVRQLFGDYGHLFERLDMVEDGDNLNVRKLNFNAMRSTAEREVLLENAVSVSDLEERIEIVPEWTIPSAEIGDKIFMHQGAATAVPSEVPEGIEVLTVERIIKVGSAFRQKFICSVNN